MGLKTENLAIVLTDIVGFTKLTARQTRSENEELLKTHNRILYPIIRHFKGRIIKTIGDAVLVVFRSPTDAMICSMAMQDSLYEHNSTLPEERQIHIRIAASLGEVRISGKDIFGEPVNVTSRIEGITPADEIYLSDAMYMAMNKAEVPCQEVGSKKLKGVVGEVRIFNIPRFSTLQLVPKQAVSEEDAGEYAYPYGGSHLYDRGRSERLEVLSYFSRPGMSKKMKWGIIPILALLIICPVIFYVTQKENGADIQPAAKKLPAAVKTASEPIEIKAPPPTKVIKQEAASVKTKKEPRKPLNGADIQPAAKKLPAAALEPIETKASPPTKAKKQEAASVKTIKKPRKPPPEKNEEAYTSFQSVKVAYRQGSINKSEYSIHVNRITSKMNSEIYKARSDFVNGKYDKQEYGSRIAHIKEKYSSGRILSISKVIGVNEPLKYSNISKTKIAYKAGKIDLNEYYALIRAISFRLYSETVAAKNDLSAGKINGYEYKTRIREVNSKYR